MYGDESELSGEGVGSVFRLTDQMAQASSIFHAAIRMEPCQGR